MGRGRPARADLAVLGVAVLAVSTSGPMIAALSAPALGARLLGRPVSGLTWAGIGLSLAGVLLLTGADLAVSGRALYGDSLAIAGGVLAAGYTTVGEQVRRGVSTAVCTSFCYATCTAATLAVCLAAGVQLVGFDSETWLRLIALTVSAQLLGHRLFNRVVVRAEGRGARGVQPNLPVD